MEIDKKNLEILKLLKENSKLTTSMISKKTRIPITTVHNRIKKMEKEGVIKSYTVVLDSKKMDKNISAYVMITINYKMLEEGVSAEELARRIKEHEFVEEASTTTGLTDMTLKVRVKDMDQLNDFVIKELRSIKGIENTQTIVIFKEI